MCVTTRTNSGNDNGTYISKKHNGATTLTTFSVTTFLSSSFLSIVGVLLFELVLDSTLAIIIGLVSLLSPSLNGLLMASDDGDE